jgi:Bacterial toxin of type II toxin-antitoxin system, YafQ
VDNPRGSLDCTTSQNSAVFSRALTPVFSLLPILDFANKAKQSNKDWTRLSHSGRYDMHRLKTVMTAIIANDGPLPAEYKDHSLEARGRTTVNAMLVVTSC